MKQTTLDIRIPKMFNEDNCIVHASAFVRIHSIDNRKVDDSVMADLINIARDGFGSGITLDDVSHHVKDADMLYLIASDDELIGFSCYNRYMLQIEDPVTDHHRAIEAIYGYDRLGIRDVLYLSGIVIRKEYQRCGLFHKVNTLALMDKETRYPYDYLAMRTQNPHVYAGAQRLCSEIYPCGDSLPDDVKRVAKSLCNKLSMANLNLETLVSKGTYSGSLYDETPHHIVLDEFFRSLNIDANNGDSVLIIGRPR
jgi:hypothetical protein